MIVIFSLKISLLRFFFFFFRPFVKIFSTKEGNRMGKRMGLKKISVATFLRTSNKHLNKNKSQNCYLVGLFQYLATRNDKRNRYV